MAVSSSLSLAFTLSHLLIILHMVEGQAKLPYACPKEFECKTLGTISFPFTDSDKPGCGPFVVDCNKLNPQIKLWGEPSSPEDWRDFVVMPSHTEIKIQAANSCVVFQNHPLPKNENISFTISPNLTRLLKCDSSLSLPSIENFPLYDEKYSDCEPVHGFTIYYNYSDIEILDYNGDPPPHCSIIELALKSISFQQEDNFYDILEEISVEWSDDQTWPCYKCFNDSRECIVNRNEGIINKVCSNKGSASKKKKLILILGPVIGGVLTLIICGIMFVIWRRKKRNKDGTYLLSRNMSFNPSSRADVEVGSVRFGVPVYTYAELEKATASFDSANELGDGGFGIVYFGKLKDGREVAVKRLYEHNYKRMEHFMNEINILTSLRHPNLVSLYGCSSRRSRELLLVYEYVPNGTVADHIHGSKAEDRLLTWPMRMNVALETANALAYLHKSEIIHRDVKTNNILLDHNFSVKVADFGLSRLFPLNATHVSTAPQGTPGYVDPDYHECYQLTVKSDVYSFGVVLIELISSLPAVDISRHRHEINLSNLAISRIQRNELDGLIDSSLGYGSDPEVTRMTSSIAELAYRCLQVEKDVRPSMDEVLEILEAIKEGTNDPKSGVGISPSPESDEVVLLKNRKLPLSPVSVAEYCISGNSGCDSSSASV